MKSPIHAAFVIAITITVTSCSRNETSSRQDSQSAAGNISAKVTHDPVKSFQAVVECLRANLKADEADKTMQYKDEISYDVRKTDSLITPIVGVIIVKRISAASEEKIKEEGGSIVKTSDNEITLGYENERWTLQSLDEKIGLSLVPDRIQNANSRAENFDALVECLQNGNFNKLVDERRSSTRTKKERGASWERHERMLFEKPHAADSITGSEKSKKTEKTF